jgi:hypothetical protein
MHILCINRIQPPFCLFPSLPSSLHPRNSSQLQVEILKREVGIHLTQVPPTSDCSLAIMGLQHPNPNRPGNSGSVAPSQQAPVLPPTSPKCIQISQSTKWYNPTDAILQMGRLFLWPQVPTLCQLLYSPSFTFCLHYCPIFLEKASLVPSIILLPITHRANVLIP